MDILKVILISMVLVLTAISGTSFAEEKQTEVATSDQQTVTQDQDQSADKKKKGDEEPECD